jgi:hypothetical protein
VEVAGQIRESSPSRFNAAWIDKKVAITAAIVILVAAIFGGAIGNSRNFGSFTSTNAKNSYHVADEIERDYNEAISTITSNYSGDIDHEKATQAAIQGMLSTLERGSGFALLRHWRDDRFAPRRRLYPIGS